MEFRPCPGKRIAWKCWLKMAPGELDVLVAFGLGQQIADVAHAIQVEFFAGATHAPLLLNPTQVAAFL